MDKDKDGKKAEGPDRGSSTSSSGVSGSYGRTSTSSGGSGSTSGVSEGEATSATAAGTSPSSETSGASGTSSSTSSTSTDHPTALCPICKKNMWTEPILRWHLLSKHPKEPASSTVWGDPDVSPTATTAPTSPEADPSVDPVPGPSSAVPAPSRKRPSSAGREPRKPPSSQKEPRSEPVLIPIRRATHEDTDRRQAEPEDEPMAEQEPEEEDEPEAEDEPGAAEGGATPRKRFRPHKIPCTNCGRLFQNVGLMRNHKVRCVYCSKCHQWFDKRHEKKCKGTPPKLPQLLCTICSGWYSRKNMARHMETHGVLNWNLSQHPDPRTPAELMLDEPGRHLRNLEHAIRVERLQIEKAGFKARIEDLEAEKQRMLDEKQRILEDKARREKEIEAEQNALKEQLSQKDKEIEEQSQLLKAQEPIELDPEVEVFQDPEEFAALREVDSVWTNQTLDFVPPNKFDPERYRDGIVQVPDEVWEAVPNVVASTLATVMGPDVPIDPMIAFRYFKNGLLPEFVVYYFNWLQKTTGSAKRLSKATIFCRSMHYIEAFREYMLNQFQAHEYGQEDEGDPGTEEVPEAEAEADPDPGTEAVPEAEAEADPDPGTQA